jgi:Arc/MetJ-type ribon-helix-helix transcriptional regulator
MTIHLPPEIDRSIHDAVRSGRFASLDEAMTRAATLLLREIRQEQALPPAASQARADQSRKPIWERIQDLTADVPDEAWDKLPADLAEQHDHYIYGTPKRPTR